ncbi:MAG: porin [Rhodobacteraceae bacterium]|nr:porin [Paracoccaceae bacterium]
MKRTLCATTALVFAGSMASADVAVTGSAELGVSGKKGKDAMLHKDIDVNFGMTGSTDTGLSFGASIDLDEAQDADTFNKNGHVFVSGIFGTLTLGDTDGAFDKALEEVGKGGSIADDHTSHPGYNGNGGLDGETGNGGNILRYDYSLGGITVSASGEFGAMDSSNSVVGAGVAWSGDIGGVGMGIGLGFQSGKGTQMIAGSRAVPQVAARCVASDGTVTDSSQTNTLTCPDGSTIGVPGAKGVPEVLARTDSKKGSAIGASASVDMGNGFSVVANYSQKNLDTIRGDADGDIADNAQSFEGGFADTKVKTAHTGIGIGYTTGNVTVGVNAGSSTTKTSGIMDNRASGATDPAYEQDTKETKASGVGASVVYGLGDGVSLQVGVGSGKDTSKKAGEQKVSRWSVGMAFSF